MISLAREPSRWKRQSQKTTHAAMLLRPRAPPINVQNNMLSRLMIDPANEWIPANVSSAEALILYLRAEQPSGGRLKFPQCADDGNGVIITVISFGRIAAAWRL